MRQDRCILLRLFDKGHPLRSFAFSHILPTATARMLSATGKVSSVTQRRAAQGVRPSCPTTLQRISAPRVAQSVQAAPIQNAARTTRVAATAAAKDAAPQELAGIPSTANGKLISKTEVAAFIQRDDMMDQILRWAIIEAGEGGVRNFGLPMNVEPFYHSVSGVTFLWGYKVGIFKEGTKLCDLGVMFDTETVDKHEWVGRGADGFPVLEGKIDIVEGKNLCIWKLDANPVDETLRSAIRAFCTGLVSALNRYYAFGSVFVDDAQ